MLRSLNGPARSAIASWEAGRQVGHEPDPEVAPDERPEYAAESRGGRREFWLLLAAFAGLAGLSAALWAINGPSVFASLVTGLWAMCF